MCFNASLRFVVKTFKGQFLNKDLDNKSSAEVVTAAQTHVSASVEIHEGERGSQGMRLEDCVRCSPLQDMWCRSCRTV